MLIGYARTSTTEQIAGYEAQQRDLKNLGCKKIFLEQISAVQAERPQLEIALDFIREGDELVVTKLDRLARSVLDALAIERRIREKGATLRIMDPMIDTATEIGRFIFTVLAAGAELERGMMLSRQKEGIAKAKANGLYRGQKPVARAQADEVRRLRAEGIGPTAIARELGIARKSVYRILADTPEEAEAWKQRVAAWG